MSRIFRAGRFQLPLGDKTYIMGILNLVPDHYAEDPECLSTEAAVALAWDMAAAGADVIDMGGQSSQPGYQQVSPEEELKRILPVLDVLHNEFSIPISIDTRYSSVAYACVQHGADIINDIGGFKDPAMIESVATSQTCGCIVMHRGGGNDKVDILDSIKEYFVHQIDVLNASGIAMERICLDPGIGFGKTYEENLRILANADQMQAHGCCTVMAASRKRVISAASGNPPYEHRMPGTIAADSIAQFCGIDMVRAHDVPEAVQAARVTQEIRRQRVCKHPQE